MPKELTNTSAKNIDKNSYDLRRKSSHFLSDLMNFNEIFRNIFLLIILKSHQNGGFTILPEKTVSEKPKRLEVKMTLKVAFLGLRKARCPPPTESSRAFAVFFQN